MQRGGFAEDIWNHLEPWETRLDVEVQRFATEQIAIRRHLHAHPEPSGFEIGTSEFLQQRLRMGGLHPRRLHNDRGEPTGLIVDLNVGHPRSHSPLIAIRADIDALRIPDQKTVDYRSQHEGVAHACGHDAHTSIALGAALAGMAVGNIPAADAETGGARLRFLFQPAEETSEGARWLIDQGAMEGVSAILGLHVDPERTVGEVGIRYGTLTANCDEIEILVEGRGGHSARPHHTTDPIAAAAHLVSALYQYLPRAIDSRNPSVFSVGRIAGGYAPNVIPERVELQGSLRTTDAATRQRLLQRIDEVCRGVAEMSGARIAPRFLRPLGAVHNDPHVTAALEAACRRVIEPANIILLDRPSMGGEDFSAYLDHAPGAMLRLGCAVPGTMAPFLHSPLFDLDERALALGTRILLRTALLLVQVSERTGGDS